jgi:hypothetical protein
VFGGFRGEVANQGQEESEGGVSDLSSSSLTVSMLALSPLTNM